MNLFRNLRLGNTALTIGLVFGVFLTLVSILFSFISPYLGDIGSYVTLAIIILFGILAGRRASTFSGKIGSGVFAGFLVGLVSSIIIGIISMITLFLNMDAVRQQYQQIANSEKPVIHVTNGLVIQEYLISLALSAVLTSLFSLAGGSLGGFLGKRRAQLAPPEQYQETMFVPPALPATPKQEQEEDNLSADSNDASEVIDTNSENDANEVIDTNVENDASDDASSQDESTISSSRVGNITRRNSASRSRRNYSARRSNIQRDKSDS